MKMQSFFNKSWIGQARSGDEPADPIEQVGGDHALSLRAWWSRYENINFTGKTWEVNHEVGGLCE